MGDDLEAQRRFREALNIGLDAGNKSICLAVLGGTSSLLAKKGEIEWAVEVASLAAIHPQAGVFIREFAKNQLVGLENLLPREGFTEAQERGRKRDLGATAVEMLAILEREDLEGLSRSRP